ncbi:hypothetical protein KX729_28925 [Rhizobium sp. XQZ8]|uniref:hypothetical protein n=1 Tax=Rhizobium populisoli TaxID=2859785 RepID=UPI001CA4D057|nr:hypothetical protein [Rhizobium populisoli]MBW6425445.1 hypothetical protein [Rhizobium populisoli]
MPVNPKMAICGVEGMGNMVFASYDTLEPKDLSLLRQVLEQVCEERNITLQHPDAEHYAHNLVNWYLFGVRQPDELKAMLKPLDA